MRKASIIWSLAFIVSAMCLFKDIDLVFYCTNLVTNIKVLGFVLISIDKVYAFSDVA